mgnify:CR=1 FL=1
MLPLIFFVAGIQSNQFTEVVHLDDIIPIHGANSQSIFFRIAEQCHIIPVNLTILLLFKLDFQMVLQSFSVLCCPARNAI